MSKHKKIQDFLNGKLHEDDINDLFSEFENDGTLKEEFTENVVKEYGRIQLNEKFNAIHGSIHHEKRKKFLYYKVAAAILVLAVASFIFVIYNKENKNNHHLLEADHLSKSLDSTGLKNKKVDPFISDQKETTKPSLNNTQVAEIDTHNTELSHKELFAYYFSPYENKTYRNSVPGDHVFQLYSNKNYVEALNEFQKKLKVAKNDEEINEILFFSAMCMLADPAKTNKDIEKYLTFVFKDTTSAYYEMAAWYLALYYIRLDEIEKARDILIIIASRELYNKELARELNKKL